MNALPAATITSWIAKIKIIKFKPEKPSRRPSEKSAFPTAGRESNAIEPGSTLHCFFKQLTTRRGSEAEGSDNAKPERPFRTKPTP